jgi:hypothetical protein
VPVVENIPKRDPDCENTSAAETDLTISGVERRVHNDYVHRSSAKLSGHAVGYAVQGRSVFTRQPDRSPSDPPKPGPEQNRDEEHRQTDKEGMGMRESRNQLIQPEPEQCRGREVNQHREAERGDAREIKTGATERNRTEVSV